MGAAARGERGGRREASGGVVPPLRRHGGRVLAAARGAGASSRPFAGMVAVCWRPRELDDRRKRSYYRLHTTGDTGNKLKIR